MKKYLIKGLLALVVGGFTASCADKDGDYVPVGQQKATAYADAFKELIGGEVSPSHDWGFTKTSIIEDFSQTRAMSRAMTRGDSDCGTCWKYDQQYDTPSFPKTGHPAPITDSERAFVKNWFETNPGLSEVGLDIQNFYLQHVWGQANKNYNIITEETGATDVNQGTMDYCEVGDGTKFTHVLDFNANSGGNWGIVYMRNSSALSFGFHATWGDNRDYHNFKLAHIVGTAEDGTKIDGYYVGLAMWGQKSDNGTKTLNYDQWQYADDWILKIVPGEGETTNTNTTTRKDRVERRRLVRQGRIFCEDLGTNADKISKSDIDFNDAVFDAKIWRKGQFDVEYLDDTYNSESDYLEEIYTDEIKGIDIEMDENRDAHVVVNGKFKYVAEICLLAAGGTIPLKIGGDKGFEIHSKFGQGQKSPRTISHTTIINTMGAPSQEQFTTTVNTDRCDAVTVEVDITEYVKKAIEHGNTDIGLDIIPIDVEWVSGNHQSVGELSSEYGQAPQKLCVPIGTPWVYERIPITTAYKDFENYAKEYSPSNPLTFWDLVKNTIDTNYLYANGPEGMTAETGESGNIGSNPFYDEVIIKGPTTTTTEVETVLWEGTQVYGTTEDSNQSLTLYSTTFNDEDDNYIRIYGSVAEGATEVWMTLHDSTWGSIISPSLQFVNGYADTQLNDNQAGSLSNGPTLNIAARNCTITKICKVVRTTSTN